jgi:hypothetical protein
MRDCHPELHARATAVLALFGLACQPVGWEESTTLRAFAHHAGALAALAGAGSPAPAATGDRLCSLLGPLLAHAEAFTLRPGYFLGIDATFTGGFVARTDAIEQIWDLYHQQFLMAHNPGAGVSSPPLEATVSLYAGYAFGFADDVRDWFGTYVEGGVAGNLPLLPGVLSAGPYLFLSAEDADGDGRIGASEIDPPWRSMYGVSVALNASADPLAALLPRLHLPNLSAMIAETRPLPPATRWMHERWRTLPVLGDGQLRAHLMSGPAQHCPEGWPDTAPELDCYVEFGEPTWTHLRRAAHLATAMCLSSPDLCLSPLTGGAALVALAIAAYRDDEHAVTELCQATGPT